MQAGISQRKACEEVNLAPKQFRTWQKTREELSLKNPLAKSLDDGRESIQLPYTQALLRFIFENHEEGVEVTVPLIAIKARELSSEFRTKSRNAQLKSTTRFVKKHELVYRIGTNVCQRSPDSMRSEAADFMIDARLIVNQPTRHQDFIINMDQTPVYFTLQRGKTLAKRGSRTVHCRKSTDDTRRSTFSFTITASGRVLTPYLVFKGSPTGRIVKEEFPIMPKDMFYACQKRAWMDEAVMLEWVDNVLKPYLSRTPPGIIPVLYLDSFRCHMMASVVNKINDLGCEVKIIPGGCTGLVQPVDVGANKPFKLRLREYWEEWMITEGLQGTAHDDQSKIPPPTRMLIAKWCSAAYKTVPTQALRNAWRRTGDFTWFPPTCSTRPPNWIDPVVDNNDYDNMEQL